MKENSKSKNLREFLSARKSKQSELSLNFSEYKDSASKKILKLFKKIKKEFISTVLMLSILSLLFPTLYLNVELEKALSVFRLYK